MEKEALSSLSQNNFILGQRVGIDESSSSSFGIGTIRFIGPLKMPRIARYGLALSGMIQKEESTMEL